MPVLTPPVLSPAISPSGRKSRAADSQGVRHLLPRGQSPSVSELAARLYAAYEVVGGGVQLAGCALELRPIVHIEGRSRATATGFWKPVELFLGDDGLPVESSVQSQINPGEFVYGDRPTRFPAATLNQLTERASWLLAENCREAEDELDAESAEIEVIWRRFAEGKLRFSIGEAVVEIPFADWADRLQPPPFICPETGAKTFRVATTDDGRMAAAEEIFTCEQSGRRLLRGETVVCSVTRQRIAADLAEQCPITGEYTQRDRMAACSTCKAKVAPKMMDGNQCDACAAIARASKSDPRMCLVLGEHPGLDRWRRWRMAETPTAYVLEARSFMHRLLVVVDKHSLEVRRLANRGRFQSAWHDVPPEGWRELLQ
jgi:hypothetical protein